MRDIVATLRQESVDGREIAQVNIAANLPADLPPTSGHLQPQQLEILGLQHGAPFELLSAELHQEDQLLDRLWISYALKVLAR